MSYLLDTNVLSELRKGARANAERDDSDLYTSVLVLGELRHGIELRRRRDAVTAAALERWLEQLTRRYAQRILPIDQGVTDCWGRLGVPNPIPVVDGLLAATAKVHGLTLVTRNIRDVATTGVSVFDPFVNE